MKHEFFQFAILLGIVFIIELAVGIAACLLKADLDDLLQKSLRKTIERSSPDDLYAWDNAQRNLMCCGVTGPADWADFTKAQSIRPSCCRPNQIDTVTNDCSRSPANYNDKYFQVSYNLKRRARCKKIINKSLVL